MTTPTTTPRGRRAVVLALIMGAQLMMVLDTSIITTALPRLKAELGFSTASLPWVQNAYLLAFGGLLLLGARAGDLFGRRRVFLVGVGVFAAASLVAGLAPNEPVMILARTLQGAASAFAIPSTLALLVNVYSAPAERSRAIAIYSAVIGAGASVGIIVGGVFTQFLSWRWGLLINVPVGALVLALAPRLIAEIPARRGRFDLPGAVTATAAMTGLVFGLIRAGSDGWSSPLTSAPLAAAVVLGVAFVLIERRSPEPIVPLSLFRNITRSGAYLGRILIVGAMFSLFYFLSQYLQNVLHSNALLAGLSYVPLTAMFFAMVYVVAPLTRLLGREVLLVVSLITALAGMIWLGFLDGSTPFVPWILLPLLVLGIGQGIAIILLTQLAMTDVAPEQAGAGSGLVNTAHQLGGSIGLAVLAGVFLAASGGDTGIGAQVTGFQTVFHVAALFYALAILLGLLMLVASRRRTTSAPERQTSNNSSVPAATAD